MFKFQYDTKSLYSNSSVRSSTLGGSTSDRPQLKDADIDESIYNIYMGTIVSVVNELEGIIVNKQLSELTTERLEKLYNQCQEARLGLQPYRDYFKKADKKHETCVVYSRAKQLLAYTHPELQKRQTEWMKAVNELGRPNADTKIGVFSDFRTNHKFNASNLPLERLREFVSDMNKQIESVTKIHGYASHSSLAPYLDEIKFLKDLISQKEKKLAAESEDLEDLEELYSKTMKSLDSLRSILPSSSGMSQSSQPHGAPTGNPSPSSSGTSQSNQPHGTPTGNPPPPATFNDKGCS